MKNRALRKLWLDLGRQFFGRITYTKAEYGVDVWRQSKLLRDGIAKRIKADGLLIR